VWRRLTVLGALVVSAGAAVWMAAAVSAGGSTTDSMLRPWPLGSDSAPPQTVPHIKRVQRLVLLAHDFAATVVDNDPAGLSQGDEIDVEGQLSTRRDAQNAGRLEAHEVLTGLNQSGGGRLLLTFTALLARGQISGVAVLGLSQSGASNAKAAIIGGTGHYRNVRGEILIHPNGQTTRLTFLLIP
jgi:hypothetical protein